MNRIRARLALTWPHQAESPRLRVHAARPFPESASLQWRKAVDHEPLANMPSQPPDSGLLPSHGCGFFPPLPVFVNRSGKPLEPVEVDGPELARHGRPPHFTPPNTDAAV